MAAVTSLVVLECDTAPGQEDSLYYSPLSYIREETNYIRKIRSALEKIQVFEDEREGCKGWKSGPKTHCLRDVPANWNSLSTRHHQVLEDLKVKEMQLSHILMENQELEIKLEASREAGAEALRDTTRRLFDTYQSRAEEMRERHIQEKQTLQGWALDLEQNLRRSLENLHNLERNLQEKEERISEIEKLVGRMEQEKTVLSRKRDLIEHETRWRLSLNHSPIPEAESLRNCTTEVNTLQEKIHHLDDMILNQNRKLRTYIQQIEQLKKELSAQDNAVWTLTERLHSLEAKNKELKYSVEFWTSQQPKKVSVGVSVT
ncbi:coiled-coil domain-containing protein 68 [Lepisosteus oculatus]|uniref:Coiled-coil domain containing 68 n=1 Tax=Lepisosteus oculatus TaxID=7918 RepID=W5M6Z9_LEPOC|nr:PREDICTED: coiled-coil domain-containing protein 68 [Lepisosteus oculatus]